MSRPADNVRVRRTRKLLRDAVVELIEERGFDRVTVGEITERAMVSRAAFYRTYRDKYQLVELVFDDAMAALRDALAEDPPRERWVGFFEHIWAYRRLYAALLGRGGSPWFATRMRAALAEMTAEHLASGMVPELVAAMYVQAITWWLAQPRPAPPREIAERTARLTRAVITEAAGW